MIETQETLNLTTMPLLSGILALIFGTFIFTLAIWRRNNRRKLIGINKFTCSDRMVNTKGTEKLLQFLAIVLFISGFILITYEAIRTESEVTNGITAREINQGSETPLVI